MERTVEKNELPKAMRPPMDVVTQSPCDGLKLGVAFDAKLDDAVFGVSSSAFEDADITDAALWQSDISSIVTRYDGRGAVPPLTGVADNTSLQSAKGAQTYRDCHP